MKKPLALLATIPLVALLAACGANAKDDGKTSVVASFYPFAYVAEQVGGSFVNVQNLTAPGAEPHDLELKPKQVAAVQEADLVVYEKHFQAAVDDAVDQADRSKERHDRRGRRAQRATRAGRRRGRGRLTMTTEAKTPTRGSTPTT